MVRGVFVINPLVLPYRFNPLNKVFKGDIVTLRGKFSSYRYQTCYKAIVARHGCGQCRGRLGVMPRTGWCSNANMMVAKLLQIVPAKMVFMAGGGGGKTVFKEARLCGLSEVRMFRILANFCDHFKGGGWVSTQGRWRVWVRKPEVHEGRLVVWCSRKVWA